MRDDGAGLVLTLTPEWTREVRERAMLQALEVIRRRVDDPQTGIQESVVTRQGQDRILVQIPGVRPRARHLPQTGFLEFKIVQDAAPRTRSSCARSTRTASRPAPRSCSRRTARPTA